MRSKCPSLTRAPDYKCPCDNERYQQFGAGGELYPRYLDLQDGRVLLTFTVRCGRTILTTNATTHHHCVNTTDGENIGLRAVLSTDHGRTFDFEHDRIIIMVQPKD